MLICKWSGNLQTDRFYLKNGIGIPFTGFGTWQISGGETAVESVNAALAAGYCHIDTAAACKNKQSVSIIFNNHVNCPMISHQRR
jgi:diketogulonate reductase-like aldo/keto reductase